MFYSDYPGSGPGWGLAGWGRGPEGGRNRTDAAATWATSDERGGRGGIWAWSRGVSTREVDGESLGRPG